MYSIRCLQCGEETAAKRLTKRFCSTKCRHRWRKGPPEKRYCRECGTEIELLGRGDANRQHCSRQCAKRHYSKTVRTWKQEHPETLKVYRQNQKDNDPAYDAKRWGRRRTEILELLGGACAVCGVTNQSWLHVDYIPTTRGLRYRHPRHFKYVSENRELFRILCANHHYELTLTGRIEGTDITQ